MYIIPVYLYRRAKYLNQNLSYFIAWLVSFFIILAAAAMPGASQLQQDAMITPASVEAIACNSPYAVQNVKELIDGDEDNVELLDIEDTVDFSYDEASKKKYCRGKAITNSGDQLIQYSFRERKNEEGYWVEVQPYVEEPFDNDAPACVKLLEELRDDDGTKIDPSKHIYILFGKMGGEPEVRWGKYDDCVMHVRTSHVPRFEVAIGAEQSLFEKMGTTYEIFRNLSEEEKMKHIRKYARGRLKQGERLWWLEDTEDSEHSLPLQAKLYTSLEQEEKRRLRAESVLLCPQVLKSSRSKHKYDDAVLYMLTYRGVLCHQARDLFSAGSVALRSDAKRGGNYLMRALQDIETEILQAAATLEDALFEEYWGANVPKERRIAVHLFVVDFDIRFGIAADMLHQRSHRLVKSIAQEPCLAAKLAAGHADRDGAPSIAVRVPSLFGNVEHLLWFVNIAHLLSPD